MKSIIEPFVKAVIQYCDKNNYSVEKLLHLPRCGNKEVIVFQHVKYGNATQRLDDSKPAEIVLKVVRKNNTFVFSPGENIKKYLT